MSISYTAGTQDHISDFILPHLRNLDARFGEHQEVTLVCRGYARGPEAHNDAIDHAISRVLGYQKAVNLSHNVKSRNEPVYPTALFRGNVRVTARQCPGPFEEEFGAMLNYLDRYAEEVGHETKTVVSIDRGMDLLWSCKKRTLITEEERRTFATKKAATDFEWRNVIHGGLNWHGPRTDEEVAKFNVIGYISHPERYWSTNT